MGNKLIVGSNDLNTLFPQLATKLVGGPEYAKTFLSRSNKKAMWICERSHLFIATVDKITSGRWCPYCSGKKVLSGFNDLATTNPLLADTLIGLISAHEVTEWSHKDGLWLCDKCGKSWKSRVANRSLGRGCPSCAVSSTSGSESILREIIRKSFPTNDNHLTKVSIPWRKRKHIQVDILLEDLKVIIEYDGAYWHHSSLAFEKDIEKTKLFLVNNYRVVRVREFASRYPYQELPIKDNGLLQIPYQYWDSGEHHFDDIEKEIVDWIKNV